MNIHISNFSRLILAGLTVSAWVQGVQAQGPSLLFTTGNFGDHLFLADVNQAAVLADGSVIAAPGSPNPFGVFATEGGSSQVLVNASTEFADPDRSGSFGRFANALDGYGSEVLFGGAPGFGEDYGLFSVAQDTITPILPNAASLGLGEGPVEIRDIKAGVTAIALNLHQGSGDINYGAHVYYDGIDWAVMMDTNTAVPGGVGNFPLMQGGIRLSPNGSYAAIVAKTSTVGLGDPVLFRYTPAGGLERLIGAGDTVVGIGSLNALDENSVGVLDNGDALAIGYYSGGKAVIAVDLAGNARVVLDSNQTVGNVPLSEGGITLLEDFIETGATDLFAMVRKADYSGDYILKIGPEGDAEVILETPVSVSGQDWIDPIFYDIEGEQLLLGMTSSNYQSKGVFLAGAAGNLTPTSLWETYEVVSGLKYSGALGWIDDSGYPHVYSVALSGWVYVFPEGASLEGFHFYSFSDDRYYYSSEGFGGWSYRLGGENPGWVFLIGG